MAAWEAGNIDAGEFKQQVFGRLIGAWWQSRIKFQQVTALSQRFFFRTVGDKAEVTDTHEAIGQDMEQEAANKFLGLQRYRLFSIPVFAISIAQGDFPVFDLENAIIGERHAVGVAAEVVKDGLGRAERFFGVDDPALLM
jgi:hypothetical protein